MMSERRGHVSARRMSALACLVVAIALTACSGGSSAGGANSAGSAMTPAATPTAGPGTGPTPFPASRNTEVPLRGGTYVTSTFADPTLTMTLPGTWTFADQGPTNLQVNQGVGVHLESTLLLFDFFGRVVDPADDRTITRTDDLIGWIEHNPHLQVVGRARSVRIGGVKGSEIDVRTVDAPPCTYYADGSRCWNLMPIIDGDPFAPANRDLGTMFAVGSDPQSPNVSFTYRLAVVELGGRQIVFAWQEATSAFRRTVKTFEQVLSSVHAS